MSEKVQIASVVAVGLVIVVCVVVAVLKDELRSGNIKVNREGVEGSVGPHGPAEEPVTSLLPNCRQMTPADACQITINDAKCAGRNAIGIS
ncbi:MAG: hypothetical protein WGN25_10665 [Candidatus Electrothrix sp. GW3-4]|uniref:hypothetical protein n=1 Tax=Candidatus Electrothrix sp. GW3-4 TaxID=3126740 RepID=UPI0030D5F545